VMVLVPRGIFDFHMQPAQKLLMKGCLV